MASLIPGYNYDIFISYRLIKEWEKGRGGDWGINRYEI
jgi:hypothetical protein